MENIDKFKDTLTGIADNLRAAHGTTEKIPFTELVDKSEGLEIPPQTYILVDEAGNEVAAAFVDEPVTLTATANDIRIGTTAVTGDGVTTGDKVIPAYHTTEGTKAIPAGSMLEIKLYSENCRYTKLIAVICDYNTNLADSLATQMVVLNDNVYLVGSIETLAKITVDTDKQSINLGIINDANTPRIIRFMTYREEL